MAVELDGFPEIPPAPHVQRATKYPWTRLFNGSVWGVKEGDDFCTSLRVFRQEARAHAKRHGYDLVLRSDLTNKILYLQARKIEAPAPPKKPRLVAPKPPKAEKPAPPPPPKPVDPVAMVFGQRGEHEAPPPPAKPAVGFFFGDQKGREW